MSSTVPKINIKIYRGDDFSRIFNVLDAGAPADLTGYALTSHVRSDRDSAVIIATATATLTDAATGVITWTLTAAQTAAMTLASMVYDIEGLSPGGLVTTLVQGKLTRDKDVTL